MTSVVILSGSDKFAAEGKPFKLTCNLSDSTASSVKYFNGTHLFGSVQVSGEKCYNTARTPVECVSKSCSCSGVVSGRASSFTWVITPDKTWDQSSLYCERYNPTQRSEKITLQLMGTILLNTMYSLCCKRSMNVFDILSFNRHETTYHIYLSNNSHYSISIPSFYTPMI